MVHLWSSSLRGHFFLFQEFVEESKRRSTNSRRRGHEGESISNNNRFSFTVIDFEDD